MTAVRLAHWLSALPGKARERQLTGGEPDPIERTNKRIARGSSQEAGSRKKREKERRDTEGERGNCKHRREARGMVKGQGIIRGLGFRMTLHQGFRV